ncbi:MAG: Hsp70 family protein, partial [Ilumatobacteraceae bacterium]
RLVEAAAKAGLESPLLVSEPVAAAVSYANDAEIRDGEQVAVYDLGGGTFDSAVLVRHDEGFSVVGRAGGDQHIGGELFDELFVNHIGEQLDEAVWASIQIGDHEQWQQVAVSLRNEARRAKEALATHPYVDVLLPLPAGMSRLRVTRTELDGIVRPYIAETITLLERVILDAGARPTELAGISLVGGSSRLPIVEEMVAAAFPGVRVSRLGDPKSAVALGAAHTSAVTTFPADRPAEHVTHEASPGTAPELVRLAPPTGAGRASEPASLSSPAAAPAAPAQSGSTVFSHDEPASLPEPAGAPRPRRRWLTVAAVVVAALVTGAVLLLQRDDDRERTGEGEPTADQHWHAAFGMYVCDESGLVWLPNLVGDLESSDALNSEFVRKKYASTGVHSHYDGVIHWHATSGDATGDRARLEVYLDNYGVIVSETTLTMSDEQGGLVFVEDESSCVIDGEPQEARLTLWMWDELTLASGAPTATRTTDIDDARLSNDGMIFTLAFVPNGTQPQAPPWSDKVPEFGAVDAG